MDDHARKQIGDVLMRRLTELIPEMRTILGNMRNSGSGQEPMDEVDLTSNRCATEFLMLLQDRNKSLVGEIVEALERVRSDEFGTCRECGDPIGLRRLNVQPTTQVCLECKRDSEARRLIA